MVWIKRAVSGIKGKRPRAAATISVDCKPLVIVRDDGEVLFSGDATIEVIPGKDGEVVKLISTTHSLPPILVHESKKTPSNASIGPEVAREGQVLYGVDEDGVRYAWRIDGAAERFLSEPWPQKWPRFW